MRKGYWYLSGFQEYGFKYRAVAFIGKVLYALRLIGDEECKRLGSTLVNAWLVEQAERSGFKVQKIDIASGDN